MKWIAKWTAIAAVVGACAFVRPACAQEVLPIGGTARVESKAPTTWAISGFEMFRLTTTANGDTPIMRTEKCDARATEIFARAQAPALRQSDIKVMGNKIVVRRYLLLEVTPADAKAAGMSSSALVSKWASATRKYLPQVQPYGSRFAL
jgi:hypothetical protein